MRSEGFRRFLLESQYFRGFVDILFTAFIATDPEAGVDGRARGDGISFSKRDSVPEKQVLPKMKPMVLAVDHPKITGIFPHTMSLRAVTRVGRDFSCWDAIK
jgi:hypothetical protein